MMHNLDNMPFNDVWALLHNKKQALQHANLIKLIELKNKYPELFDKEIFRQLHDMIDYCVDFQSSDRYKKLKKQELLDKLHVIHNPK